MPPIDSCGSDHFSGLSLTKTRSRWLLARNTSESEDFKKKASILDKARNREEKAFQREKERLLKHQVDIQHVLKPPRYSRFECSKEQEETNPIRTNVKQVRRNFMNVLRLV